MFFNHEGVSKKYLKVCGKSTNYTKVGLLSFDGYNKKLIWDKEWFTELVSMPFEYTQLDCPKQYDPVLKNQYGNYMKFVKGGAIHTMAVIDPDTPYKILLKEKYVILPKINIFMSVHQALQRIRETLKLHINVPKTLYFNFKVFDFRQAVRLPVFLYGKVDLDALHRGCVELSSKVRTGGVKFGGGWYTELYGYSQRHKSFLRI